MKYYNKVMDIRRMEAELLNRVPAQYRGKAWALPSETTYTKPAVSTKTHDREEVTLAVGPCLRSEGKAYGTHIARKGGVHSGGVFVSGEIARGRGAVFVTVGGSRLIKG